MSAVLADPLVPSDTDVRGYQALPIEVTRLLTSETWIMSTPAERSAAMCLWLASWQQVPAGSLPNNDRVLSHLSMAGSDWPAVREMALRGWTLCADNRLYHPVVCEKAVDALAHRKQRSDAAAKRWNKRPDARPETESTPSEVPPECDRISDRNANAMQLSSPLLSVTKEGEVEGARPKPISPSVEIIRAFDEERTAAYGAERSRGWPHATDGVTADRWLAAGADVDLCRVVFRAVCKQFAANGRPPPDTLSFFEKRIANQLAERSRPMPEGQANVHRPATTREAPEHAVERRRDALAGAVARKLATERGGSGFD